MASKQVLVVDDERNIRLTLTQCLEGPELRVHGAINGEDALRRLQQAPVDLVLLDLKLPGLDGLEVLRRLRAGWPQIPVVIVTAHGTVTAAVDAMKLGAVDLVQKPFSPAEIRQVVGRVLAAVAAAT